MKRKFEDVEGGVKFVLDAELDDYYVSLYVKIDLKDVSTDVFEIKANAVKLSSGALCRIDPDAFVCKIAF